MVDQAQVARAAATGATGHSPYPIDPGPVKYVLASREGRDETDAVRSEVTTARSFSI